MAQKKKIVIEEETEAVPHEDAAPSPESDGANAAEAAADGSEADLETQLEAAQNEAKDYHDRMLRMAAELDNYKKRAARELEEIKKYATENLLKQLLPVVDNLERAIASASTENQSEKGVVDGVALTLAEITKFLEKHYVSPIEALGQPFDPTFHQAMCQEESTDQPPNTVVREFQKGYLLHDRLLRPTMVVVSKAAQDGQPAEKSVDTNA
jgi:molecular chaperone GrpE